MLWTGTLQYRYYCVVLICILLCLFDSRCYSNDRKIYMDMINYITLYDSIWQKTVCSSNWWISSCRITCWLFG